jgi:hypothetical protein
MWLDLLPINESYFPHLGGAGVSSALDLRYDSTVETALDLRKAFHLLIRQIPSENREWLFSFAGTLVDGQNLSLLAFLAAHQFETAFNIFETCKYVQKGPMPVAEISFFCSLDLLELFMKNPLLDFGWDFRLGGWLVEAPTAQDLLREPKFRGQFYYPPASVDLGFCTSEDWDCIQFFSFSKERLMEIQRKWMELRQEQT